MPAWLQPHRALPDSGWGNAGDGLRMLAIAALAAVCWAGLVGLVIELFCLL